MEEGAREAEPLRVRPDAVDHDAVVGEGHRHRLNPLQEVLGLALQALLDRDVQLVLRRVQAEVVHGPGEGTEDFGRQAHAFVVQHRLPRGLGGLTRRGEIDGGEDAHVHEAAGGQQLLPPVELRGNSQGGPAEHPHGLLDLGLDHPAHEGDAANPVLLEEAEEVLGQRPEGFPSHRLAVRGEGAPVLGERDRVESLQQLQQRRARRRDFLAHELASLREDAHVLARERQGLDELDGDRQALFVEGLGGLGDSHLDRPGLAAAADTRDATAAARSSPHARPGAFPALAAPGLAHIRG